MLVTSTCFGARLGRALVPGLDAAALRSWLFADQQRLFAKLVY